MGWLKWLKRYWLECVLFLAGAGLQVSPLNGWGLALLLWILAVLILSWHLGVRLRLPVYLEGKSSDPITGEKGDKKVSPKPSLPRQPERNVHIAIFDSDEYWWEDSNGRRRDPDTMDYTGFGPGRLVLYLFGSIAVQPKMLVDSIRLQIGKMELPARNWESRRIDGESGLAPEFVIPKSITPGEHDIWLIAMADGEPWKSSIHSVHIPKWLADDTQYAQR